MLRNPIDSIHQCLRRSITIRTAAVFAGAGLVYSCRLGELERIAQGHRSSDVGLDVNKENDLITVAQFHVNEHRGGRHRINQALIDEFSTRAKIN